MHARRITMLSIALVSFTAGSLATLNLAARHGWPSPTRATEVLARLASPWQFDFARWKEEGLERGNAWLADLGNLWEKRVAPTTGITGESEGAPQAQVAHSALRPSAASEPVVATADERDGDVVSVRVVRAPLRVRVSASEPVTRARVLTNQDARMRMVGELPSRALAEDAVQRTWTRVDGAQAETVHAVARAAMLVRATASDVRAPLEVGFDGDHVLVWVTTPVEGVATSVDACVRTALRIADDV